MLLQQDKDAIFIEGVEAFKAGKTLEDNPHPLGSAARAMWEEGYESAIDIVCFIP